MLGCPASSISIVISPKSYSYSIASPKRLLRTSMRDLRCWVLFISARLSKCEDSVGRMSGLAASMKAIRSMLKI